MDLSQNPQNIYHLKKMNKIIALFPFLLIFLMGNRGFTQIKLIDVELSTQYVPASKYTMPIDGSERIGTNSITIQNRYNAVLNFNLSTKIDTSGNSIRLWNAVFFGDYLSMENKNYIADILPESLLASNISVQHYRSLKNRWAFVALLSAGINSDLNKIDDRDIFANVGGLFIKSYTPKFSIGFGLFVNNNFGKPLPWPAITVNWQLGERYKLDINVPDISPGLAYNISFAYAFNKRTDLAIYFKPSVISYDIENTLENKRLLNNWQIPIGLKSQWHTGTTILYVNGGLMVLRSFDYAEKDLSKVFSKNPSHSLTANIFVGLGAKYRL